LVLAELAVRTLEDALIGIMDAVFEKTSPSCASYTSHEQNLNNTVEIVSSYKKLIRSQCTSSALIVTSNRALAAEEECTQVWEKIWNKQPNLIKESGVPPYEDGASMPEVNVRKIWKIRCLINTYPSTKACGEDGMYIIKSQCQELSNVGTNYIQESKVNSTAISLSTFIFFMVES